MHPRSSPTGPGPRRDPKPTPTPNWRHHHPRRTTTITLATFHPWAFFAPVFVNAVAHPGKAVLHPVHGVTSNSIKTYRRIPWRVSRSSRTCGLCLCFTKTPTFIIPNEPIKAMEEATVFDPRSNHPN